MSHGKKTTLTVDLVTLADYSAEVELISMRGGDLRHPGAGPDGNLMVIWLL